MVAKGLLTDISDKANYVPIMMNFSAQTSSQRTQEMIEVKLEKKRKNILGLYSLMLLDVIKLYTIWNLWFKKLITE